MDDPIDIDMDLAEMPDETWAELWAMCVRENARRETLRQAREQAEAAARKYEEAVADSPARKLSEIGEHEALGPGERLIDAAGLVWENVSGAWLGPHVAGPAQYPTGWRRSEGSPTDPAVVSEWDPRGHAYRPGDLVSYQGVVYRVIQAHSSQSDWVPSVVPALYVRA